MGTNVTAIAERSIAIGVMAYNEERNIRALLESLLRQTCDDRIARIVVVASGCTDRTCDIVEEFLPRDSRLELITEGKRAGKIAAINTFLATAAEPYLVVSCGDLIFRPDTIEKLCEPLGREKIGMTGAHPVPINEKSTFPGFAVHLMWDLHHKIAQRDPKMGELIAFRNVLRSLPTEALCDELSVENQVRAANLDVAYVSEAAVFNKGPETLSEFFRQRCRWIAANFQVIDDYHLHVSTMDASMLLKATLQYVRETKPRLDWLVAVAAIEFVARAKAYYDYHVARSRQKYRVWDPVGTTKHLDKMEREAVHKDLEAV
ncbi:MAG TPA: glycosyltransferase [Candidatus Aquilonibacter sp.]|nr:glycosyltransferase [Candidatus Aquilonibacter sp.]